MPMSAQVGFLCRNRNIVASAFGNITVAPGADVGLERLVGLYAPHLNWPEGTVPHNNWR